MVSMEACCSLLIDALRIVDVEHRVAERVQLDALKLAGKESGRPLPRGHRLHLAATALRQHHDEAGKILAFDPRP